MTMVHFEHDPEADAVYIRFSEKKHDHSKELDRERIIDYADDGTLIGIELLCVSLGVNVDSLPNQATVGRLLEEHNIKVLSTT